MPYSILGDPRGYPGTHKDRTLGTLYEIQFETDTGWVDSVVVEDLNPETVDKLIKEKIAKHAAIMKLGKT